MVQLWASMVSWRRASDVVPTACWSLLDALMLLITVCTKSGSVPMATTMRLFFSGAGSCVYSGTSARMARNCATRVSGTEAGGAGVGSADGVMVVLVSLDIVDPPWIW